MRPQVEVNDGSQADLGQKKGQGNCLIWLTLFLLLLAGGAVYLLWKRLRGRRERPRAGDDVAWNAYGESLRQVQQAIHAGYDPDASTVVETRGINLLLMLLVCLFVLGGTAFAALLLFDGPYPEITAALPELDFFDHALFDAFESRPAPIPVLQKASAEDRVTLTELKRNRLNSYGWVSREAGIVHIPLERAMELAVQQGLPTAVATATPSTLTPSPGTGNVSPTPTAE